MQAERWMPNWRAIARKIVRDVFALRAGERVVYLADPYLYPELLDEIRYEVLDAEGIEQATILNWTPKLATERQKWDAKRSSNSLQSERDAHLDLFNTADVFMWLPFAQFRAGSYTDWESEWILGRWRGRGMHFHWFADEGTPEGDPIHIELQKIYERAILDLDYAKLKDRQGRLVEKIRGKKIRVTTPSGTDVSFELPEDGWYHRNDGDASREKVLKAKCARDREEEIPCGAVRSIPSSDSVNGMIKLRGHTPWNGFGLDVDRFSPRLDISFRDGRVVRLDAGERDNELKDVSSGFLGDWDRLSEVVFGTNPLLETPPKARMPAYWGFGEGWFRFHLGENVESGGTFNSPNLYINLFVGDATIDADEETLVRDGKLLSL